MGVGEDMAQPRVASADRGEQRGRAFAVLNVGGVDRDGDEMAAGVGDDMALAPFDLFTSVKTAWPPASRSSQIGGRKSRFPPDCR